MCGLVHVRDTHQEKPCLGGGELPAPQCLLHRELVVLSIGIMEGTRRWPYLLSGLMVLVGVALLLFALWPRTAPGPLPTDFGPLIALGAGLILCALLLTAYCLGHARRMPP